MYVTNLSGTTAERWKAVRAAYPSDLVVRDREEVLSNCEQIRGNGERERAGVRTET